MPNEGINQPKGSTDDQLAEEPKIPSETPPSGLDVVSPPPEKKSSRRKLISGVLILLLLLASIPAAVYLVQQRQELRKAACHNEGDCFSWQIYVCGKATWKGKVRKKGTSSWQEEELVVNDNDCHWSPDFDYHFELSDGDWVEWELYEDADLRDAGEYQVWNCPAPTPTPTPTPEPTPTPKPLACTNLGGEPDPGTLLPEDEITLTCAGSSDPSILIDHFEFRVQIDGGDWENLGTASASQTGEGYQGQKLYTLPDYGCYKIECRACVSEDSSDCTVWGQAERP